MPDTHLGTVDDARYSTWLRSAGIAAITAAALGSILFAAPAMPERMPEPSSTDESVQGQAP